jgi:hypothetical protein
VQRALEQPLRTLCDNAGVEGSVIVEKVKEYKGERSSPATTSTGSEYVDMFKAGIIDPTKVSRTALQNAASVASLLLTTEALVTEIPEKKKAAAARVAAVATAARTSRPNAEHHEQRRAGARCPGPLRFPPRLPRVRVRSYEDIEDADRWIVVQRAELPTVVTIPVADGALPRQVHERVILVRERDPRSRRNMG